MVVSVRMVRGWTERSIDYPYRTALCVYLATTLMLSLVAPHGIWRDHTPYNHFALLAQSWLDGRLDLPGGPPAYAGGNDFARLGARWFVVFPGFPALLLVPWVALAGEAARVPDGAFFLLLAGLAPAGLYLTLHRIREARLAVISGASQLGWSLLYVFGTVYFFTAVQGTVWFAAHVVAAVLSFVFLWASIEAKRAWIAGLALAGLLATRPPLVFMGLFFLMELRRVSAIRAPGGAFPWGSAAKKILGLGLPVAVTGGGLCWLNYARFGDLTEFGYRYLSIVWQSRIEKWGLFNYHYLARNLGIVLTNLPYLVRDASGPSVQINGHGLALWVTSPFFLWLLWPKTTTPLHRSLYVTLPFAVLPSLLYQNSGWLQFGQRFSNDYAPILFVLLAIGGYAWSRSLKVACLCAVIVNTFGAWTFGRVEGSRFYFIEGTQRVIYQPD